MAINDKVRHLLEWYHDSGITTAIAEHPKNNYGQHKTLASNSMSPRSVKIAPTATINSRELASSCQTLAELRDVMENFNDCALKLTATNLVFADGNPQAKVMVVGEAPGADEDRQGKPFVGMSGQLLDRALATIGLTREIIYISNIIPWRPPGNRPPTTEEIALCQPFIERHIELIKPEILILVGGVSAKTLLRTNEGILKLRGQWQHYTSAGLSQPIKTLATLHPAYLLRSPGQKALVWQDMLLVADELERCTSSY